MNKSEGVFGSLTGNPHFDKCSWSIEVEKFHTVSVEFTQLQLPNCEQSYLAVYDGKDENSPLLEKYCGSKTKKNRILSSGHQILILLKSFARQDVGTQPKFEAKYNTQQTEGKIDESEPIFLFIQRIMHWQ